MTKIEDYLTELDGLLVDVDPATREGLLNGIREELSTLTPADADARLRALGDPAFVAASVRAERGTLTLQKEDAAWYSILTVLLLTVGGFIIPVIGWLAGLVMLWASRTWAVSHKVIGTLVALGGPGLAAAGLLPWAFVAVGPGESTAGADRSADPVRCRASCLAWRRDLASRRRRSSTTQRSRGRHLWRSIEGR